MVESIKELRKICYKGYKQPWFSRVITRTISLYLTKLFLYTSITPNQITLLVVFFGLLSALFFSFGIHTYDIIASLFFMFKYILDGVDGNIARYRKSGSTMGFYFDRLQHRLVEPLIFIGLGYGAFVRGGNELFILMGALIALSLLWVPAIIAEKVRAFYDKGKKIIIRKEIKGERKKGIISFGKKVFNKIGWLSRPPFMINILIILAILDYTFISLFFYSILLPIVVIGIFLYESRS